MALVPRPEDDFDDPTRELVLEARGADAPAALRELYDRVGPSVYSWARLRLRASAQRRIDPEEIVQETWLRALRKIGDYDPERPFRAWIFKIARYVLIEASRELPRGEPQGGASEVTFFRAQPDAATGVSTIAGRNDALEQFLDRVAAMSDDNRELVVLRGLEGRSFDEIAARLGESADTLGKRWQRLRDKLAQSGPLELLL